jgi:hypothetical protein
MRLIFFPLFALLVSALTAAPMTVTEIGHEGQPSFRIETPVATWVYHREGAGFASLFDAAGNDWIAYRPQGGAAGNFRGIPNAVHRRNQDGNNFFHPGHSGSKASVTTLVSTSPDRVVLRSVSVDRRWICEWEILPDRAHLRMNAVPQDDGKFWFLYEGTPGGRFDPTDVCLRPNGEVTPLSERWESTLKDVPWVAFISPARKHALVLVAHRAPDVAVSYRPMENAMTVFGFGRTLKNLDGQLSGPLSFTVALIRETDPAKVSARALTLQTP